MNATNVMTISPKVSATGKGQLIRDVSKSAKDVSKESFGEVLGKAGEDSVGKLTKSPMDEQGNRQGIVYAKEADIKDDVSEGTDVSLPDKQQTGKNDKAGKAVQKAEVTNAEDQELGKLATQAVVLNFFPEVKNALGDEKEIEPLNAVLSEETIPQQKLSGMALIDEKVSPERASLTATVKESVLSQSVSPAATVEESVSLQSVSPVAAVEESVPLQSVLSAVTVEESVSPQSVSPAATVPSIPATSKFVSSLAASAEELVPLKILAGHEVEQQGNISSLLSAKEETQQPEIASRINLQSLLPQSAEEAQRNDNFLAMLSGRQVKMVSSDNLPSNMLNQQQIQGQGMDFLQGEKPATLLDAQLNDYRLAQQLFEQPDKQVNTAQGEDKAAVIQGGQIPKSLHADTQMVPMKSDGLALAVPDDNEASIAGKKIMPLEQNEGTMTSGAAERVNDSATSGAVSRVMLPKEETVQLNVRKEFGQVGNDSLLNGKALGDTIPVAADNTNMQQDSRQGSSFQQNQSFLAMTETVVTEDGKAVEQLTEEAVGDKAPASKQASTNSESVTMFQQNLNESLNGTKGTDNIGQSQQVRDDFNVPRQIVEQARLLRRGEDTQMVIKLHPDHLGELTLKVSVSANGAVNASFHSDNAQVRAIIENTLVQLKQELNNQGLKVDNVDVYAGFTDGQLPQGEGQQAWQQNQQHGSSIRNIGNMDDYGEDTDTIVNAQENATEVADGVDYRI